MKEISYKLWRYQMAELLGIDPSAVAMRISRGTLKRPSIRKVNKRVLFVKTH